MSTNLSCTPPAPESELALDNATVPPAWTRRPVDAVDRWKAGDLTPHRFARVVREMNANERVPTRASLELCGYDRAWPIVLHEGQILDGRARAELALELWRDTGRDDVIPSFVELVPNDPDQSDEAALLYLPQRLVATRSLTEGERVTAAFRLFQLYRESRARRPALALEGHGRFASRSRPHASLLPSPASARGRSSATRSSRSTAPKPRALAAPSTTPAVGRGRPRVVAVVSLEEPDARAA